LNWTQIKEKALQENKYIFLDCFTTWCGPCKRMEKEVYTNDTVGDYFNTKFISVKVQMDKTKKDDKRVQSWYQAAEDIASKFKVQAYPTFIFLSPSGKTTHKEIGFKLPKEFVQLAQTATSPGKKYLDPYTIYDSLMADYEKGIKNYNKMPYMAKTALSLGKRDLASTVAREYINYLKSLSEQQLYTIENIEFLTSVISTKSQFFNLFFPDGRKVDSVMNKKGYTELFIDKKILKEDIEPFIKIKTGGAKIMYAEPKRLPEPDWDQLHQIIERKYNRDYAERNLLNAKIIWYENQQNIVYLKYFIQKWKNYGMDTTDEKTDLRLNHIAWDIFEKVLDRTQINEAIEWMRGVVRRSENVDIIWMAYVTDTYANLLYKSGKKDEAIKFQLKALNIAVKQGDEPLVAELSEVLAQMKKGEPTWKTK